MKNLLSIQGGGLYGVGPANYLAKFPQETKFDYIAGTSTGAIIAALMGCGKYTLKQVADLYNGDLPKKMFTKPSFPASLNFTRSATYDNKEAKKQLQGIFGEMLMKDMKIPTIIVAWCLNKKTPKIFTHKVNNDYKVWEAVLASMSAPTYFPVFECRGEQLVDGGVCANMPSLAGIAAMRDDGIITKDIKCLSLHTTGVPKAKKYSMSTIAGWIDPLIEIITMGNAEYSAYVAKTLLDGNNMQIAPTTLPNGDMADFKIIPDVRKVWERLDVNPAIKFLNG